MELKTALGVAVLETGADESGIVGRVVGDVWVVVDVGHMVVVVGSVEVGAACAVIAWNRDCNLLTESIVNL